MTQRSVPVGRYVIDFANYGSAEDAEQMSDFLQGFFRPFSSLCELIPRNVVACALERDPQRIPALREKLRIASDTAFRIGRGPGTLVEVENFEYPGPGNVSTTTWGLSISPQCQALNLTLCGKLTLVVDVNDTVLRTEWLTARLNSADRMRYLTPGTYTWPGKSLRASCRAFPAK